MAYFLLRLVLIYYARFIYGRYIRGAHIDCGAHTLSEFIEVALLTFFFDFGPSVNHIMLVHIHHINDFRIPF
jgi:hypothetical protein